MAEVGLVAFTKVAYAAAKAVLPPYRSRNSKHQFTQPQLLAILCLMRFEDWTFREAEVRLAEHRELRRTLGLWCVPDYTTLYRFLRRVSEDDIRRALELVARSVPPKPGRKPRKKSVAALDGTGLSTGATSSYFCQHRQGKHEGLQMQWGRYLKWLLVMDVDRYVILAQMAKAHPCNDSATLRPLIDVAAKVLPVGRVLADAEFDSELNHKHIREKHKAQSIIPAKRGRPEWRLNGIRAQMREAFPEKRYHDRVQVESLFSSVKRKLSSRAAGIYEHTQRKQALILGLAYNIYRL